MGQNPDLHGRRDRGRGPVDAVQQVRLQQPLLPELRGLHASGQRPLRRAGEGLRRRDLSQALDPVGHHARSATRTVLLQPGPAAGNSRALLFLAPGGSAARVRGRGVRADRDDAAQCFVRRFDRLLGRRNCGGTAPLRPGAALRGAGDGFPAGSAQSAVMRVGVGLGVHHADGDCDRASPALRVCESVPRLRMAGVFARRSRLQQEHLLCRPADRRRFGRLQSRQAGRPARMAPAMAARGGLDRRGACTC